MAIDATDTRLAWAIEAPEWVVLLVRYQNSIRIISPVKLSGGLVLAFDLSRENYRTFSAECLEILNLVWSWSVVPPAPLFVVG